MWFSDRFTGILKKEVCHVIHTKNKKENTVLDVVICMFCQLNVMFKQYIAIAVASKYAPHGTTEDNEEYIKMFVCILPLCVCQFSIRK